MALTTRLPTARRLWPVPRVLGCLVHDEIRHLPIGMRCAARHKERASRHPGRLREFGPFAFPWRFHSALLRVRGMARQRLVDESMSAWRAIRDTMNDPANLAEASRWADEAKIALGERGPAWWTDGQADLNRHLVTNMPCAAWFGRL
ncbi:hypothetical protein RGR602_PC02029 (plasmid) [Rhizobium gallicum bv. gallicum R602sp]|uniref:Uncharacterized protein n=3 Tax=Rhizobium TaxID=379 RepID=A0A0B4XHZ5_9HYPH|nr:hypothetical protein RGR602_PC02029 [Rhizobium gallicum bv. gallicum R602sp]